MHFWNNVKKQNKDLKDLKSSVSKANKANYEQRQYSNLDFFICE